jgi:hypothetical protein
VQPQPDANVTLHLYSSTSSSPDLSNNIGQAIPHITQDGTVILYALSGGSHDVAVTNLTSAKTVICQGYNGNLTATVQNQGSFTETFTVTVYANTTSIASQNVTLSSGNSTTITFTWNTTGFAKGNYTKSAYAWPVQNETNTANNNFTDGVIRVSIVGDVTGVGSLWNFVPDGKCDGKDITAFALCFGSHPGSPPPLRWEPNCDMTNDGKVDGKDITVVALHFGQHDP